MPAVVMWCHQGSASQVYLRVVRDLQHATAGALTAIGKAAVNCATMVYAGITTLENQGDLTGRGRIELVLKAL